MRFVAFNESTVKMWAAFSSRILTAFFLCFSAAVSAFPPTQGQQETVRVQTTLVHVPVIVSDPQGVAVVGLKAEDFALRDDTIPQPLAFFKSSTEPIKIALVLDTSKSTATVLPRIRQAASDFVSQLRPQDQAMVVTFDSDIDVLCRFGADVRQLKTVLRSIQVGEYVGTRMYDAVSQVADKYLRSGQERKAMVLLTDGQDYGSQVSAQDMTRTALETGVVVYPVFYPVDRRELAKKLFGVSLAKRANGSREWEQAEKAASDLLARLAAESAGALYRSESADLKKTFGRIIEELRHQYLLAFYPDPGRIDGVEHAISVSISRPDAIIRHRRSYLAQKVG